jgi:hypothetical protein
MQIISPRFSFVQFNQAAAIENCLWDPMYEVLPVVNDNDIWFQFIIEFDNKAQADSFCADTGTLVRLGISEDCSGTTQLLLFSDVPERFRIDDTHVGYNWVHGLTGFQSVVDENQCFVIFINVDGTLFCSNQFKRLVDTCHTSVLEYGNDDNFADFNYCGGISLDSTAADCTPTEITFTNELNISIPYTAELLAKYGNVPTVQVWIYDDTGVLVDMGIRVTLDGFPPSIIFADFGGPASGVIKIS